MTPGPFRLHQIADNAQLIEALTKAIGRLAGDAIRARSAFHIVLAGGNTPRHLYRQLVSLETDWQQWHIYFGDERCMPAGSQDRNDTMAREAWLDHVTIPSSQIHPIQSELGAEEGAIAYDVLLSRVEQFDLVLLGIGEDGHTASLFPGHAIENSRSAVPVHDAPKPPPDRVSMTARRLGRSENVWVIATGEGKREALQGWIEGKSLPVASIWPGRQVELYTDLAL